MSLFGNELFETPYGTTAGWSRLGQVLGDNNQVAQNAYQRGMLQGVQGADVMEQARRRRDQNMGFSSITPQIMQSAMSGDPVARAELASSGLHAGINLSTLGGGLESFNTGLQEQQLFDAARSGTPMSQLNPALAVMHGQPLKLSSVEGNTLIDPYALPGQQGQEGGNVPTAVGQSDISKALAEAEQAHAGAFRNTQQGLRAQAGINADKAGNYVLSTDAATGQAVRVNKITGQELPVTDASGKPVTLGAHGGGQMSDPKPEVLEQAFGKPNFGAGKPNQAYLDFKLYQRLHAQDDPAYNNGDYALAQYISAKSGTAMLDQFQKEHPSFLQAVDSAGQNSSSAPSAPASSVKTITRTGTAPDGRKVVQYSDGSIQYAD